MNRDGFKRNIRPCLCTSYTTRFNIVKTAPSVKIMYFVIFNDLRKSTNYFLGTPWRSRVRNGGHWDFSFS